MGSLEKQQWWKLVRSEQRQSKDWLEQRRARAELMVLTLDVEQRRPVFGAIPAAFKRARRELSTDVDPPRVISTHARGGHTRHQRSQKLGANNSILE